MVRSCTAKDVDIDGVAVGWDIFRDPYKVDDGTVKVSVVWKAGGDIRWRQESETPITYDEVKFGKGIKGGQCSPARVPFIRVEVEVAAKTVNGFRQLAGVGL